MRWTFPAAALACGAVILGTAAGGIAIAIAAESADAAGGLAGLQAAQRATPTASAPAAPKPESLPAGLSPDGPAPAPGAARAPVVTVPALTRLDPAPPPTADQAPAAAALTGPAELAPAPATAPEPAPPPEPPTTEPPTTEPPTTEPPAAEPPAEVAVVPPYSTVLGWHGDQRVAYLTFDDGPAPATARVLDILAATGVKATFCMVGSKVVENPDLARRVVTDGHTVCNHSWDHHSPFDTLPPAALDQQLGQTQDAIARVTGVTARYFRAPEGRFGDSGGTVLQACQRAGTVPLGWGVDSLDWKRPGTAAIVAGVLGAVSPGAVILMHDGGGTDREQSIESLPAIIAGLRAAGYTLAALPADPGA